MKPRAVTLTIALALSAAAEDNPGGDSIQEALSYSLLHAIAEKRWDAARGFIDQGADINFCHYYGTLIHRAMSHWHWDDMKSLSVIEALVDLGADVNVSCDRHSPLLLARARGQTDIADYLVSQGAAFRSVNMRDRDSQTALHIAATRGSVEGIQFLLKHGADIDATDKDSRTPLHRAIGWGMRLEATKSEEGVRLLLQHGADASNIPLMRAINSIEALEHIVQQGANLDSIQYSDRKWTALHIIAEAQAYSYNDPPEFREHLLKVASVLIDNGASVDIESKQGHLAWFRLIVSSCSMHDEHYKEGVAYRQGIQDMVRVYLKGGADSEELKRVVRHECGWDAGWSAVFHGQPASKLATRGDAGRGFTYSNVSLAETKSLLSGEVGDGFIGEMSNASGRDYSVVKFKISLYGEAGRLVGVATLGFADFRSGETKSFVTTPFLISAEGIQSYRIAYDSGWAD